MAMKEIATDLREEKLQAVHQTHKQSYICILYIHNTHNKLLNPERSLQSPCNKCIKFSYNKEKQTNFTKIEFNVIEITSISSPKMHVLQMRKSERD